MMSKSLRSIRGFTLLELTLVILILGVFLSLLVPQLKVPYGHYNLESAAYRMAGDIRYFAQQTINAQSDTDTYKVNFDTSNDRYLFQKNTDVIKSITLPVSTDLEYVNFNKNTLSFKINGAPSPLGGTVTLRDRCSGDFLYVIVAGITGRVRVDVEKPASGVE
jgi:prepilin-type N-terminal cleavage/methylation domain-containing protein